MYGLVREREDALREGLEGVIDAMQAAKARGDIATWVSMRQEAEQYLLAYVGNGYITRLWDSMGQYKP